MKENLKRISISRLRKLELPNFYKKTLEIVEKHNPEELLINESFVVLEGLKPQADYLVASYGAHPLTEKIDEAHKNRIDSAILIVDQMNVYIKANKSSTRSALELIKPLVKNSLIKLQRKGRGGVTETINYFTIQIDKDELLEDAFSELKLSEYIDEMRSENSRFIEFDKLRTADIASRPKTKIPPIVKEVNAGLRNLFNHINLSQARNPGVDYSSLIDELNVMITSFDGVIKARDTKNKNKAEATANNKGVVIDEGVEGSEEPASFTVTTNGMHPANVKVELTGVENGKFEPFGKEEKAAASSSKILQPPFNSSEA